MEKGIFDEDYEGYVSFSNNTWITNKAYIKDGVVIWNNGMSQGEIEEINEMARVYRELNDAILESDYYRYAESRKKIILVTMRCANNDWFMEHVLRLYSN